MTTPDGENREREGLYFRMFDLIFDPLIPDVDRGPPRLFPRVAALWAALVTVACVLTQTGSDALPHNAGLIGAPPTMFVFVLYAGLFKWCGPGRHLVWMVFPITTIVVPLRPSIEGRSAAPVLGVAATALITGVASAEWLRRRAMKRTPPTDQR